MPGKPSILLVSVLRAAFNGRPFPSLDPVQWDEVFEQAAAQGVETWLYPELVSRAPEVLRTASCGAVWRLRFLQAVGDAARRRGQLAEVLGLLAAAGIAVIPLKGAWLAEGVYDDPACRPMGDLDLLVPSEVFERALAVLTAAGYAPPAGLNVSASRFDHHVVCLRPGYRPVELHWQVADDDGSLPLPPDLASVWATARSGAVAGVPVQVLPPEQMAAALAHHLYHHLLAFPLRAWLDIALLLRRFDGMDRAALLRAAEDWRLGAPALGFVLRVTADLFDSELPAAAAALAPGDVWQGERAEALAWIAGGEGRILLPTRGSFYAASLLGRLRLVVARVFMPRDFLAVRYSCARKVWGMPLAWCLRLRDLVRRHGQALFSDDAGRSDDAGLRRERVDHLLRAGETCRKK